MSGIDNLDTHVILYQKIVEDTSMLPPTRRLASTLQQQPYMVIKDFLLGLSDDEVFTLLEVADQLIHNYEECEQCRDIVLIAEMLTRAEGLISHNDEEVATRTVALCSFLACEGLARRGLVKIYRENMSFGQDMIDSIILEKQPGVDYDSFSSPD